MAQIALLMFVFGTNSWGAILYSGLQDIGISSTFGGVYLDFDDPNDAGSYVFDPAGVATDSTTPVPWDLNFFFGGAAIATSDTTGARTVGAGPLAAVVNLAPGATISVGDTFPGGFSGSLGHMGPGAGQFTSSAGGGPGGTEGYLGILIDPASFSGAPPSAPLVGWMRVTLEDDGSIGTIHDWAWESSASSIEVGAIPEPGLAGFVLVAMAAMLGRRKRQG